MTLTIDDVVTHYILSSHPRNRAIVDIKNKKTGKVRFIKIRHRLSKFYAVSIVDPVTFEVWAETQVKSASARVKPIILHLDENKNDTPVELRDTSRIGFEWSFIWEGEKYRWVRESRMSNSLECRAVRKTGDICVAQYLPRTLQDEYFGIFSLLGYNILRCNLTRSCELELIILMSLMTLLDKSNDGGWKRDAIGKGVQDDVGVYNNNNNNNNNSNNSNDNSNINSSSSLVPPMAYEDPIPKKAQQKKYKVEALNDQKLQLMLEKDVRRSQKQIQSDQKNKPLSAGNSPNHTPKGSPLPTPSTSSTNIGIFNSPRLRRQKSAGNLNYYGHTTATSTANSSNISTDSAITPISPTNSGSSSNNASGGKLSRLFSTLSHIKQTNGSPSATAAPVESKKSSPVDTNKHASISNKSIDSTKNATAAVISKNDYADLKYQQKKLQQKQQKLPQYDLNQQQYEQTFPYYDNYQHGFTIGQLSHITNEFGNLSISNRSQDPISVRNVRWNPEPLFPPNQTNPVAAAAAQPPNAMNTNKYNTNSSIKRSPRQQPVITSSISQHLHHRSNSQDRRRPRALDEHHRRLSFSEYTLYAYNNSNAHPSQQQQHPHYAYNIPPPPLQQQQQPSSSKYNRYSTSEYYAYQQQQQQYDYYQ